MPDLDLISLDARGPWDEALDGVPHSFHHRWEFAHAMHLTTGYPTFLVAMRTGEERMVCPLIERAYDQHVDIATPSGLSGHAGTGDWSHFACLWDEFVRDRGYVCGYIGLHPLFAPAALSADARAHNSIYVLRLDRGQEALASSMDRNRRRELRSWDARARGFTTDRGLISEFLVENYESFMRQRGARAPYLATRGLRALCDSEETLVVGSALGGGLEAVFVFGVTSHGGECLVNVTTGNGQRRTTDLIWYGVNALIERGITTLNLGGGVREDDSIARAKQRFGAERLPLRALRQIYRADAYAELCALAARDAAAAGDYFPAYRSPDGARLTEQAT